MIPLLLALASSAVPSCPEPAPIPECREIAKRDGPGDAGRAAICELCTLRSWHRDSGADLAELRRELADLNRAATVAGTAKDREIEELQSGTRTRATLVAVLATAGAASLVGGIVAGEPWAATAGAVGVAAAVVVARF